jgi:hypothetical protein
MILRIDRLGTSDYQEIAGLSDEPLGEVAS